MFLLTNSSHTKIKAAIVLRSHRSWSHYRRPSHRHNSLCRWLAFLLRTLTLLIRLISAVWRRWRCADRTRCSTFRSRRSCNWNGNLKSLLNYYIWFFNFCARSMFAHHSDMDFSLHPEITVSSLLIHFIIDINFHLVSWLADEQIYICDFFLKSF